MLRFILKVKRRDEISGYYGENIYTIDGDVVELEKCLKKGGYGECGYESHELVGIEVINDSY